MKRNERIVALLSGLLDAGRPVPFSELQTWFDEDYGQPSPEAAERKFERDKADLLQMGVPIRFVPEDDDSPSGYVIDAEKLFLPPLELDAGERAALRVAAVSLAEQPGFPFRGALSTALEKLTVRTGLAPTGIARVVVEPPAPEADTEEEARLEALAGAVTAGKRVTLTYHAVGSGEVTEREVDPYGLYCHRGDWMCVGRCHLRQATRTFFVRRMRRVEVNEKRPGTADFEVPGDFRLRDWIGVPSYRYEVHAPLPVVLEVDEESAVRVERELSVRSVGARPGWRRVELESTHLGPLVGWVLAQGAHVRVLGPVELKERIARALAVVAARHGGR